MLLYEPSPHNSDKNIDIDNNNNNNHHNKQQQSRHLSVLKL